MTGTPAWRYECSEERSQSDEGTSDLEASDMSQAFLVGYMGQDREQHVLGCFPASWVIVPRASRFVERWDLFVSLVTMFTAFWTPYQVAFGGDVGGPGAHFRPELLVDALLDLTFFADVIVQFFTAYQPKNGSALWEKAPDKIAKHYLKGWFSIDFASIIPVSLIIQCLGRFVWNGHSSESERWITLFVFLRLLKLLRLLRMARVARVVQRWQYDLGLPYAHLSFIRCILMVVLACHWIGCVWGFFGQAGQMLRVLGIGDGTTWLTLREDEDLPKYKIYTLCFYWAVVTLTTVGYGDISPKTEVEFMLCTFIIFIGASIWAYVVGGVCAIISNMDPQATTFQQRMDDLNAVMDMIGTPKDIRRQARDYMHESKVLRQRVSGRAIFAELSDCLRGQLEKHNFEEWLNQVWYLRALDYRVVAALAMYTHEELHAPLESIGKEEHRALYYLRRGLAYLYYHHRGKGWMVQKGKAWGVDIIVNEEDPFDRCSKKAVTYAEVCTLSKADFDRVRRTYPAECAPLRKAEVVLRVKRALVRHVQSMKQGSNSWHERMPPHHLHQGALLRQPARQTLSPRSGRHRGQSISSDGFEQMREQFNQVVTQIQGVETRLLSTMTRRYASIEERLSRVESRVMRQ